MQKYVVLATTLAIASVAAAQVISAQVASAQNLTVLAHRMYIGCIEGRVDAAKAEPATLNDKITCACLIGAGTAGRAAGVHAPDDILSKINDVCQDVGGFAK